MGLVRAAGILLCVVALGACGGSTPTSTQTSPASPSPTTTSPPAAATTSPPSSGGSASGKPVACTSVTSNGTFASPDPATLVTIDQISQAVGFTVSSAIPDTQSAIGFHGYESCRYQFTTPAGGAQEDIYVVVGTNPADGKSAAAELATTQSKDLPLSGRDCTGDCAYKFTALPGVGDSALKSTAAGQTEVIAALKGRVYVEVGPGDLKESRMVNLANLILGAVT